MAFILFSYTCSYVVTIQIRNRKFSRPGAWEARATGLFSFKSKKNHQVDQKNVGSGNPTINPGAFLQKVWCPFLEAHEQFTIFVHGLENSTAFSRVAQEALQNLQLEARISGEFKMLNVFFRHS